MPEFLDLIPPHRAWAQFREVLPVNVRGKTIPTAEALGRVTYQDVQAPVPLPDFRRSTVDGYAVKASDTHGASDALPAYLSCIGEVPMGRSPDFQLEETQCALIHTGGMIPPGANAVVMVEDTQETATGEIEIFRAAGVGENVIEEGEDVAQGELVIPRGSLIRPAEIGGLMALGITEVMVSQRPRVGIISSGDEVISPAQEPVPGEVRDVNTYTLSALIEQAGGKSVHYGIVADREDAMTAALRKAQSECQLVIVTAGSSASARDLTARVMDRLGRPGVLVHGVNVKPGKPTILGAADDTALIGLPGNPVSALVIASLFVVPVIRTLLGERMSRPPSSVPATLIVNVASASGREDWVPVKLERSPEGSYQAQPIFGKSNLIFILSRADGLVRIPSEANGVSAGAEVTVRLF